MDINAFNQWVDNEEKFWEWLRNTSNQDGAFSPCWSEISRFRNRVNQIVGSYKAASQPQKRQLLDSLQAEVSSVYSDDRVLPSSSSRAQYVDLIRSTKGAFVAASVLAAFLPRVVSSVNMNSPYIRVGVVLAVLFDEGVSPKSAVAEKNALNLLHQEWSKSLEDGKAVSDDAKKLLAGTNQEIEKTKTSLEALRGKQAEELEAQRENQSKEFAKLLNDKETKFNEITKAYDEKLALLAPVQYWENKAKSHAWGIGLSAGFWVLSALGAALLIWFEVDKMGLLAPPSNGVRAAVDYIHYALVFATGSLLLWPLRVLARIFFSSLHLREDAKERVTMAKVYLSLLRSDQALRGGSGNSDSVVSGSLAAPTSPRGGELKERGDEENATESRGSL